MKKIDINDSKAVALAAEVLRSGGIVMHPTETCYGFAVDIFNKNALDKLYRVKGMDKGKPVSVLVDGFGMANEYGLFSDKALELVQQHWPGPLSIIVPRKSDLSDFFNPGMEFVSLRCSSDDFCGRMVGEFGGPVTTTSVNRAGEPALYKVDLDSFGHLSEEIDLIVDGGEISKNQPSTIVKVEGDVFTLIRQGAVLCE